LIVIGWSGKPHLGGPASESAAQSAPSWRGRVGGARRVLRLQRFFDQILEELDNPLSEEHLLARGTLLLGALGAQRQAGGAEASADVGKPGHVAALRHGAREALADPLNLCKGVARAPRQRVTAQGFGAHERFGALPAASGWGGGWRKRC